MWISIEVVLFYNATTENVSFYPTGSPAFVMTQFHIHSSSFWNLSIVLICVSPVSRDEQLFHVLIVHLYYFFYEIAINFRCPFLIEPVT